MMKAAIALWLAAAFIVVAGRAPVRPPCSACVCPAPVLVPPEIEIAAIRVVRGLERREP